MDRQNADAVAAPDDTFRGTCQHDARGYSAAPSDASIPPLGPFPDTGEEPNDAEVSDAPAPPGVACPVKSASQTPTEMTASTTAIATVASDVIVADSAPPRIRGADGGGAAGSNASPAESTADPAVGKIAGDALSAEVRAVTSVATCEAEAGALTVDTDSLPSATSQEGLLKKSRETKGANANISDSPVERPATARHRRNTGRARPLAAVGKSVATGGDSQKPVVSACSAVTTGAAVAVTRAGSSSGYVNRREQERVKRRYEPLMRETEEALQKVLAQGLPEAEILTHPQVYLKLKRTILADDPPAEDQAAVSSEADGLICREAENESNAASSSRVKRLLRALCEGSSLPLSKLIHAVRVVLLDETDGAPREDVSPATLQSLIPVLLSRRSLGIPPRRALTNSPASSSPADQRPSPSAAGSDCGTPFQPATASAETKVARVAFVPAASIGPSIAPAEDGDITLCTHSSSPANVDAAAAAPAITTATAAVGERGAGDTGPPNAFSGNTILVDRNEDTTPSCLWVWESAFLEGLPPALKEKVKKDREKRAVVSRRVRSLLRLQQAIDQGIEKEIFLAQEKVAALEKKQQQEEERRREQQLKKRRAEEARLEKEREKKQKEDAKREKEKERKKTEEQQKQTLQQSAGGTAGGGARSQTPGAGKTEKAGSAQKGEKKKELPSSMLNQQLLMASWLTRKPLSCISENFSRELPSGAVADSGSQTSSRVGSARGGSTTEASSTSPGVGNDARQNTLLQGGQVKEGGHPAGVSEAVSGPKQASSTSVGAVPSVAERGCFPWERMQRQDFYTHAAVVEVDGDPESGIRLLEKKTKEIARARAAAEAALWRVPEGKRHQFVERVLNLPKALIPLPSSSDAQIPFFDGHEDIIVNAECEAADAYLKTYVTSCAVPHSEAWREFYVFFATHRQYVCRLPARGGMPQLQSSSNGSSGEGLTHTYCQEMREVRKGLALTDYADVSLPDLEYLRTVVINLDEWKRPVRRLLLGKCAKQSTAWKQCVEESCVDYDRDSDEEWFETFDVDDLDDGREEEEEEDQEADEDKDWLVDDEDDDVEGFKAGSALLSYGVRFESLCDWRWTFEGEEKPNHNHVPDACAIPTVQDPGWLSIYGCVVDDWRGQPFSMLEATGTIARRKLTDEELCSLFRFCHGKTGSKIKLLAQFHKQNQHVRKSDLEKKFKEYMTYERRGDDRFKRWYVSCNAAENLNLKEELNAALETARANETLREAAQSICQDSLETSAVSVSGSTVKQSQAAFSWEKKRQPNTNGDGSPDCPLNRHHLSTDECSPTLTRSDAVDTVPISEVRIPVQAGNYSPTLLTSSPAKDTNSSLLASMTLQESLHDGGTERRRRFVPNKKRGASVVNSVPTRGNATPDSCSASSTGTTSVASSPSSAGSTSSVKNRASAPPPVNPPVSEDAREKISAAVVGAPISKFRDAGETKERRTAGVEGYELSQAVERLDLLHTVDPFASAAATAALAASSAQAAATTAYEKRPAASESARRVALAALVAAKLAKEVALQMSDGLQYTGRFGITRSSPVDFCGSSVGSNMAAPKSPSAEDSGFRLQSAQLRDGADRSLVSSTLEHIAGEEHSRTAVVAPVQESPVSDGTPCYQQRSPMHGNAYCSVLEGGDAESISRDTLKRRRSDGSLQSYCGSSDGSACSNKRRKRPSCPSSGALPTSAGRQLKNALITKFFKAVSQVPKRIAHDATDEIS